jgi:hypothetical protein
MKPQIEGWNIVLAGFWNRMIFTPEWVMSKLTTEKDIGVEIQIGMPGLQPRLVFEGITLKVDPAMLVLGLQSVNDEALQVAQRVALSAMQALPHTPMSAVGVNFQFVEAEPDAALLKPFRVPDLNTLADEDYEVQATQIRRQLHRDGRTINFTLDLKQDKSVLLDFNFHSGGNQEAAQLFLQTSVLSYRDQALDLLKNCYGLVP